MDEDRGQDDHSTADHVPEDEGDGHGPVEAFRILMGLILKRGGIGGERGTRRTFSDGETLAASVIYTRVGEEQ